MARKKDSEDDKQARLILSQLNSKTVGAPLASTGLIGDQAPDTIFTVEDFDKISNQINLQLSNVEALNLLNTIGQITSKQSQSGPIPGTGVTEVYSATDAESMQLGFSAAPGEAWVVSAASTDSFYTGQSSAELYISDGTNAASIDRITSAWYEFNLNEPTVICAPLQLRYSFGGSGSSGTGKIMIARHRVR